MEIRKATPDDAEAIAHLNRHVHALHVANVPDFFRTPTTADATDAFRASLEKDTVLGYLAVVDEEPVGYLVLVIKSAPANAFCREKRVLYLEQIGVDPTWQGQGIGKALVAWTRGVAREQGIAQIEVESWAFNTKAQAFFQAQGFGPRLHKYSMRLTDA